MITYSPREAAQQKMISHMSDKAKLESITLEYTIALEQENKKSQ